MTMLPELSPVTVPASSVAPQVSVVVIGRNEGERLVRCLASVLAADWHGISHEVIYVDSCSRDDSLIQARRQGALALLLDDASPCASKARNLGWHAARGDCILFLDGDTELDAGFVRLACATLQAHEDVCAVWGHRRESDPQQSWFTRVLDLDWVYPVGPSLYFGGDVLIRREALLAAGGFDPQLKAGEEPELCARLRAAGWKIMHVDAPMTRHDLAIRSWRAYWLRAYRSGMAYAEVAERMRRQGDPLWQHEARRDFLHGWLFLAAGATWLVSWFWWPWMAAGLTLAGGLLLVRTAWRCRWKAPGQPGLCWLYAVHVHLQKISSLFGQLHWRRHRQAGGSGLIDYKQSPSRSPRRVKSWLADGLTPLARLWQHWGLARWLRVWSVARLQAATGRRVAPSNVVLGPVEVQGSGNIRLGERALIYPGCYFETQGAGRIEIGDDVVLSRGVHIVAFDRVTLGAGCMVGEYSSLRDANHRSAPDGIRHSGHDSAPLDIGRNVWIGRGVAVLKGASLGDNCIVAANAVVNRPVAAGERVGGLPARPLTRHPQEES